MKRSEEVWQAYHSLLRYFIKRNLSDDAAADDILHEVFLKMHSSLATLKDDTKLHQWIYRMARNAIVDYFRSRKPTVEIPGNLAVGETDSTENVYQELAECLQPMVKALPDKYREAIILSEFKGLKQKEVARLQGISISGAKSRIQRGRALLKQMLYECCRLQFDHRGRLCGYERKEGDTGMC